MKGISNSREYSEIIIPSQDTQVSPYRDLFKGWNKAPGALAKWTKHTFHMRVQQCTGAHSAAL